MAQAGPCSISNTSPFGLNRSSALDSKRLDKVKTEMKQAEDYLSAADILYKNELYGPSCSASYNCSYHASLAALLTSGEKPNKESFAGFHETIKRFSKKIDPYIEASRESARKWGAVSAPEHSENEALLRLYQTKEFMVEVKGFIKKLIR